MTYPMSFDMTPKQNQSAKQTQRLMMSPQMQQAIQLLQMPLLELSTLIETEIEQNPVLDYMTEESENEEIEVDEEAAETNPEKELSFNDHDYEVMQKLDDEFRDYFAESGAAPNRKQTADDDKRKAFQDSLICHELSLFEYLMQQAKETFESKEELAMAEAIIGNLDQTGFLGVPMNEIAQLNNFDEKRLEKVLNQIQTFEPYGVGAKNLQEALLIQLRCLSKQHTLAYQIAELHYDDLLHNRIPAIKKSLGCTLQEVEEAIQQHISKLDLHPGSGQNRQMTQYIIPDVSIKQDDNEQLIVSINDDVLPPLKLNPRYTNLIDDPTLSKDAKEYIKKKIGSAKWLIRNIYQRNDTLEKIVRSITKRQQNFFLNPDGQLTPMTMLMLAEELELHESTIARAVSNKYLNSPRGLFPLRYFFTNAYITDEGVDISSDTVRNALKDIIQSENKRKPLSDAKLSELLSEKGITCARRTIAKYRTELNLGNAQQRRKF